MSSTVEAMVTFPMWRRRVFKPMKKLCFVLMPFTKATQKRAYSRVVKRVIAEAGLEPKREDESHGLDVMEDVWINLNEARCVLADVTGGNPNVLYEVGIANTLGKPLLILSADPRRKVPFDLNRFRHVFYDGTEKGLKSLRATLPAMIQSLLNEYPSGNHIKNQLEDSAAEWVKRMHDHMLLNRVELLNAARRYVLSRAFDDDAVAYAIATAAHCSAIDHLIYWGRECGRRAAASTEVALWIIPHPERFRRPRLRGARVIEQLGGEAKSNALRHLYQHGLEPGLAQAIKDGALRSYVGAHAESLGLSSEEAKAVLIELEGIVL
jgi:hypothetical protein